MLLHVRRPRLEVGGDEFFHSGARPSAGPAAQVRSCPRGLQCLAQRRGIFGDEDPAGGAQFPDQLLLVLVDMLVEALRGAP